MQVQRGNRSTQAHLLAVRRVRPEPHQDARDAIRYRAVDEESTMISFTLQWQSLSTQGPNHQ